MHYCRCGTLTLFITVGVEHCPYSLPVLQVWNTALIHNCCRCGTLPPYRYCRCGTLPLFITAGVEHCPYSPLQVWNIALIYDCMCGTLPLFITGTAGVEHCPYSLLQVWSIALTHHCRCGTLPGRTVSWLRSCSIRYPGYLFITAAGVEHCPAGQYPGWGAAVSDTRGTYSFLLQVWNIARLDSILAEELQYPIPGVNRPYLYFGMWKATFPW
jgi:hypothetical protein